MPVIYKEKVEYAYTDPGVKAHTLSWAEYQALPTAQKMNGDLYFIPDKQPEGNPSRIWAKLGTEPLDTEAEDVSGAVNELNSSLTNLIEVITITNVSTDSNGNYVTSYDWVDGKYIAGYSYQTPSAGTGRWFMTIRPSAGNKVVCHAFADDNSRINRTDVCFVFYKINN